MEKISLLEVDYILSSLPGLAALRTRRPELHRQLIFKTSQIKKRKLSPQHIRSQDSDTDPDIPLRSVEESSSPASGEIPRFDLPPDTDSALPPYLPPHLQTQHPALIRGADCTSSAASSPSTAYASLSLDNDRSGEQGGLEFNRTSAAALDADTRAHSPPQHLSHRSIMGGAADFPKRASSPLKRPASDLEADSSSQRDDVDMVSVPPSDPQEPVSPTRSAIRNTRAQSVDMLRHEVSMDDQLRKDSSESKDGTSDRTTAVPPIDEQIKTVTSLCSAALERQIEEGEKTYLVSKRWLQRVTSRGSDAVKNNKIEPEGDIGPIDNSDIIQQVLKDYKDEDFVQLKHGSSIEDFELFPEEVWTMVVEWYGLMRGTIPIIRIAHNTSPDKQGIPNVQFELHPPIFKVHRLFAENNPILIPQMLKVSNPPAPLFFLSRSFRYDDFLKAIKSKAGIPTSQKVRVWRVPKVQPAAEPSAPMTNTATPPSSRPGSPSPEVSTTSSRHEPQDLWKTLFLEVPSFLKLEKGTGRELVELPDSSVNPKYNGNVDLGLAGLGDDQTIVIDESTGIDSWVSNHVSKNGKIGSAAVTRAGAINSQTNSGRSSPAPSGPMTRGRAQISGKTIGTVGLSNLGNTCYMNSALQCVRSVEELTKYFLSGSARSELNVDNPLGNHGEVAIAYEKLLDEIYKDPVPTSYAPRYFKTTIGRYAPSFSGYGQQDSQEFLGFLLDGLQEDLSRVKKKPYIEKPDSTDEMVNDAEAISEMAAKVWDITKKRDDSVIADLFTGMYKSTLVCPICDKVSITFDPFNNLTLQLPIESSWTHEIFYFPLNDKPVRMQVDIDRSGSILSVKQFISGRVGVPVERLFLAEEFKSKFYKFYQDHEMASEQVGSSDHLAVYEVEAKPTNWPPPRRTKKKSSFDIDDHEVPHWDDPLAERMIVPVFSRHPPTERNDRFKYAKPKQWALDGAPYFILLTPEEARDEDVIKRKILEKVATFTTWSGFEASEEEDNSIADSADPDMIITTGSDADSSGSSKVVATSVDGEDEIVNISMKESNAASHPKVDAPMSTAPIFNNRRPAFTKPGSFLPPEFQNLFDVGYCLGTKELIAAGWNTVDDDKTYPSIASRKPQQSPEDTSMASSEISTGRAGSETSEEDSNTYSSATRMNDESESEEDSGIFAAQKTLPLRTPVLKSGSKVGHNRIRIHRTKLKTYSKKQERLMRKRQAANLSEQESYDEGPLIRLGEALIVDWHANAWDVVFGADGPEDTMRGEQQWSEMPLFKDQALEVKRKTRAARKKSGITLDDCLNEFGKEEILSEMDTWYCPRCKEHRRASKKFELWKTPDILVMHLKRFSSSANRRDKVDILVDFPIEGLDLTSRVIEIAEGKPEVYDLFAVDDHWGGLGGGHYTAYAKNFNDGEWYEYNDSSVSKQKDPAVVVTASAYLLFYRRRSDGPLGGPRIQKIIQDYDNKVETSDDEASESGEDQGLVGNSSQHGSSSALTGVEAVRRQHDGSPGVRTMTINPSALERLPAYEAHEENDDDAAPLLESDARMNDGLELLPSVEEDEGIGGMHDGLNYSNLNTGRGLLSSAYNQRPWSFESLGVNSREIVSGTGSDAASDEVQNNSSAGGSDLMMERMADFAGAPAVDEDGAFVDQSPVPDMSDEHQAAHVSLQQDFLENMGHKLGHNRGEVYHTDFVPPEDGGIDVEEPATEIHIEDDEDESIPKRHTHDDVRGKKD